MSVTGSFNDSGSPVIEIGVSGPLTQPTKFTAMMDTGFSGFLLLPLLEAFPVGLILRGTLPITLADGSTQTKLTCLGEIHFDGKSEVGLIIIEWQSTDILIGMDFLRKFRKTLTVDAPNGLVVLTDSVILSNPTASSETHPDELSPAEASDDSLPPSTDD